jgi:hypothetical protein
MIQTFRAVDNLAILDVHRHRLFRDIQHPLKQVMEIAEISRLEKNTIYYQKLTGSLHYELVRPWTYTPHLLLD